MAVPPPAPATGMMMTMTDQASAKSSLRATMRARRAELALTARPIEPPPQLLAMLATAGVVASYLPVSGEADPALLMQAALEHGCRLALPHVTGRGQPMRFLSWMPGQPLITGLFGLRQPDPHAEELAPDLVLTPLLAFDRTFNRLGQGAGYYDRAFAALPAVLRIGVAWSIQRVDTLPTHPWDVPLHGIVTETGWKAPEPSS